MIEFYWAYVDYRQVMDLTQALMLHLAARVCGDTRIAYGEGQLDLEDDWPRLPYLKALGDAIGVDPTSLNETQLARQCEQHGQAPSPGTSRARLYDLLFKLAVEPGLLSPTFVIDYPRELSPLAKAHREDPNLVERFELFIGGSELANGFSELNDPLDQRARFESQMQMRTRGDDEAHVMDEDYVRALEFGMPPTAGVGVGFDRVVMLLTNRRSIRDVILFPQMRPQPGAEPEEHGESA
jgi:lysyl-tRNA synthetase class 2